MIKKIAYLGVIGILFSVVVSCEKDFTDVGSAIIKNDKFITKKVVFDVEIKQQNITSVDAGNTKITRLGEYLLGIYKKENAKTLHAGIVSQLSVPSNLKLNVKKGQTLQPSHLDAVILKIPVKATKFGSKLKIDSLLGNPEKNFTLNVYRNLTFLNKLNPKNPSKNNVYLSNSSYKKDPVKLNKKSVINFNNLVNDTIFIFNRKLNNGSTFKDTLKIVNNKKTNPFIVIELDKNKLKEVIFDKYKDIELSTQDNFNNYFRGIIIEVLGNDGSMIPVNLNTSTLRPSIDFIHTSTVTEGSVVKDTLKTINSFYLNGISNSIYTMSGNASLANNVVLQGTAGTVATVKILDQDSDGNGISDLEELRKKNIIVNDAILSFDINTSADTLKTPKRLFLHKNEKNKLGKIIPTQLSDLFNEGEQIFNGKLQLENKKPNNYTFKIRRHVSEVVKGSISNSELTLKVFNTTDLPQKTIDTSVKNYNWNPRSVSLLNNSTKGGKRGIKLTISYTEEK